MSDVSLRALALGMQNVSLQNLSRPAYSMSITSRQLSRFTYNALCRSQFQHSSRSDGSQSLPQSRRDFSTTTRRMDWLTPKRPEKSKSRVGRPRMPTGGSVRGTTVVWGDYGLRMKDHDRRVSAKQLKIGEETIRRRLRGMHFTLYKRVSANIGVYTKGNEVRMGKGKGKFDYWAARIPVSRIIFEVSGNLHEKVVRDAFRLAGHKLPGLYEFVKKGDPPVVGVTKLGDGVTLASLKAARRPVEMKEMASDPAIVHPMDHPPQTVSSSM